MMGISREKARMISKAHLISHLDEYVRIEKVISPEEAMHRLPSIYLSEDLNKCWIVYLEFPMLDTIMLGPSTIMIISKTTGEVLYSGTANDEG